MATTTPNFGWAVPTSTDLVKDGAVAIETLGDSIDASLVDLKGGTTGQVLTKASGTDMDFSWTAVDPLVILDAKGDLITATAADTPARLAVGTNGQVLTADSTAATGLAWATPAIGGLTKIATATLSGATSISFTSIPTTYKRLQLIFSDIYQSSQDVFWAMRLNNDSTAGKYVFRGGYTGSVYGGTNGGTSSTYFGSDFYDAPIGTTRADDYASQKGYGVIDIFNTDSTSVTKQVQWQFNGFRPAQNQTLTNFGNGYYDSTTAISRVDFIRSSTQTITGTIELWGSN
jgi:hypothetical protein